MPQDIAYRAELGALGAYLDAEGARGVTVLETTDGFEVRYERGPMTVDRAFLHTDLSGNGRETRRDRQQYGPVLAALGVELERLRAYTILITETEGNWIVTYQFDDPVQGYQLKKDMMVLDAEEFARRVAGNENDRKGRRWKLL